MNREIKFRGLRKDGGGWAKGALCDNYIAEDTILVDYVPNPTRYEIGGWLEVIPETVQIEVNGQWFSDEELLEIVKKGLAFNGE